jgi:hypothetical protein
LENVTNNSLKLIWKKLNKKKIALEKECLSDEELELCTTHNYLGRRKLQEKDML